MMKHLVLGIGLLLSSCGYQSSNLDTDLGTGNDIVADTFKKYQNKNGGCVGKNLKARRVIVSGFGLFSKAKFNISGSVVNSMADPKFIDKNFVRQNGAVASGTELKASDHGARTKVRNLKVDAQIIEFCFIEFEVRWDLAAAILLHEIARFRPHAVVMSGLGTSNYRLTYEIGAINQAVSARGYHYDGRLVRGYKPKSTWILPPKTKGLTRKIFMNWNATSLAKIAATEITNIGSFFFATAASNIDPGNNYVCNNLSFIVVNAIARIPISLAGGKVEIDTSRFDRKIKAGFIHFPIRAQNSPKQVYHWARILALNAKQMVN